jgi:hypothetical protein
VEIAAAMREFLEAAGAGRRADKVAPR